MSGFFFKWMGYWAGKYPCFICHDYSFKKIKWQEDKLNMIIYCLSRVAYTVSKVAAALPLYILYSVFLLWLLYFHYFHLWTLISFQKTTSFPFPAEVEAGSNLPYFSPELCRHLCASLNRPPSTIYTSPHTHWMPPCFWKASALLTCCLLAAPLLFYTPVVIYPLFIRSFHHILWRSCKTTETQ